MSFAEIASLLALALFGVWSVVLSVVDVRTHRLPNRWVLAATVTTAPALLASSAAAGRREHGAAGSHAGVIEPSALIATVGGAAVLGLAFWLLWCLVPAGIGGGDVKLAPLVGAVLGCFGGWPGLLGGTIAAFGIAAVWGAALRTRRAGAANPLAFAPCLCVGAWLIIALH